MTEREDQRPYLQRGISLRQVAPNAVTALALCVGLSSVRFAFLEQWQAAVIAILVAALLDGMDGAIARALRAESRFGAELDSLSDSIAFGVAPALLLFFWSMQSMPRFGWLISLTIALACALRLARFNARIDDEYQPHKSAGYLTGVPAPAGAIMALLPILLWFVTGYEPLRHYALVGPWIALCAFFMISSVATFSWTSLRLRKTVRLEAIAFIALAGVAFINEPWITLSVLVICYILTLPISIWRYRKVRQRRRESA